MTQNQFPSIRPVTLADRDMVNAFFDQMGGESRAFFNAADGNRIWMMRCFDEDYNTRRNFVATEMQPDGTERIAGLVFLWELDTLTPWLGIAVAEDWKGRHLGRQLMSYAEEYCKQHGKGGIFLTTHMANLRGQGLYTRSGYKRLGTHSSGEILFFHPFPDTPPQNDGTI